MLKYILSILVFTAMLHAATITSQETNYDEGQSLVFTTTQMPGNSDDWIGIYPLGASNDWGNIVDWKWAARDGDYTFDSIATGEYEIRVFFNNSFVTEATDTFSVHALPITTISTNKEIYTADEAITMTLTGMSGDSQDWVGIYPQGANNDWDNVLAWAWTGGILNGDITIDGIPEGNYEVRAFFNNSFVTEATDTFTVSNNQEVPSKRVIEDAEDGDTATWSVYDNSPEGASIENIYDASNNSQVIKVQGEGTQNGYIVGNWAGRAGAWNEREHQKLSLKMNFPSAFNFFVTVQTTKGSRYLYYSSDATDRGLLNDRYIHHGLGSSFVDGNWHTFSRDLQADLQEYEADNSIIAIDGLLIRGSGMIDDITLFSEAAQEDTSVKIFIIGDSTVHNTSQGEAGWGSKLGEYTDENVIIFNQARSGSSSKSYKIASASHHDWTTTKSMMADADISHGAYLFIQFGHNDEKKDEYLHTEAGIGNSFYTHLKEYVDEARAIGVIPVLITSVNRQYVGSRTHGQYPQTMRYLAEDENVILLDLEYKSFIEFKKYDSNAALQNVFSYDDGTHFNPTGAGIVAGWVKELACQKNQTLCSQFK